MNAADLKKEQKGKSRLSKDASHSVQGRNGTRLEMQCKFQD